MILGDVPNCNIYLDDVVIYSSTWVYHIYTLHNVFSRLAAASLTLNLMKCDFAYRSHILENRLEMVKYIPWTQK